MGTHLIPEAFNKACSLMFIKVVEHRPPSTRPNIILKGAIREFSYFASMGDNFLRMKSSQTKYFIIERDSGGISIIPKPGGLGIYITKDNQHLMTQYMKHSPKPTSMTEWRRIFGNN